MKSSNVSIGLFCLLAILAGASAVAVTGTRGLSPLAADTARLGESQVEQGQRILEAAKRHIIITDTLPFVGQVTDANFLRAQYGFFENARNGDFLIVTQTRAILYRPTTDILVDVLPRADAERTRVTSSSSSLTRISSRSSSTSSSRSAASSLSSLASSKSSSRPSSSSKPSSSSSKRSSSAASARSAGSFGGF